MKNERRDLGFTIVELMVVIGIMTIVVSLLCGAIASARAKSLEVKCLAQLHNLGIAFAVYREDDERKAVIPFSPFGFWPNTLRERVGSQPLICPAYVTEESDVVRSSYATAYLLDAQLPRRIPPARQTRMLP
jgi:prepilin-type N-terminal cleavage/methylation domain-containing protein